MSTADDFQRVMVFRVVTWMDDEEAERLAKERVKLGFRPARFTVQGAVRVVLCELRFSRENGSRSAKLLTSEGAKATASHENGSRSAKLLTSDGAKATPSHGNGSSSADRSVRVDIWSLVMDEPRGFQHVFKSKAISSRRVQVAHQIR
jgi:hypothetical protein